MLSKEKVISLWSLFVLSTVSFEVKPHYKVAMMMYDGFTMLDLIGPAEVFGAMPETFEMHVVSKNKTNGALEGAFNFVSEMSLDQALKEPKPFDMIVMPGGTEGTDRVAKNEEYLSFVRNLSKDTSIVFSICTGSLILASSGVLDGKNATTNKFAYWERTPEFPKVHWVPRARWVTDGKFVTSSGISAGIDAAFHIVSQVKGQKVAKYWSDLLEYKVTWDPSDDPFAREKGQPIPKLPADEPVGQGNYLDKIQPQIKDLDQTVENQTQPEPSMKPSSPQRDN